jgi:hypothetical protein
MQTVQCRGVLVLIDVLTAPGANVTVARLALGSAHSAIAHLLCARRAVPVHECSVRHGQLIIVK